MNDKLELNSALRIVQDSEVTLHFSVALLDGTIVDSNFESSAATFVVGDGSFLPGFEQAIMGLKAGDRRAICLPAKKAFGEGNPKNIRRFQRKVFADDIELQEGLMVSFESGEGELPGVVKEIKGELVVVDFNHPLAGQDINFQVEIVEVAPSAAEQVVNFVGSIASNSKDDAADGAIAVKDISIGGPADGS